MTSVTKELMDFINKTPNAFQCIENLKKMLDKNGYQELFEYEKWDHIKGKYYVVRGDSSLIAFNSSHQLENRGFHIVAAHTDSPSFSIKPNCIIENAGYLQLNIEGYGSMINHTWLDRPLSIAGRVIFKNHHGEIISKMINIDKDLLVIPSQAIHMNREVNQKNNLNHQIDMIPILSLKEKGACENAFTNLLLNEIKDQNIRILDYDLYLYNRDQAKKLGEKGEFLLAPRLDDLACLYPSLKGFMDSQSLQSINVFCAFHNEEIGSGTKQGADSNFLLDTLTRITDSLDLDLYQTLSQSFIVSADNAHAIHPNALSKFDPTNHAELNKGIVIKHHINYTTDSLSSSIFKEICHYANVPYQDFSCRSDMPCGKTLGGISTSHVAVNSVDIGLAQLAMHSSNELIGVDDPKYLYDVIKEFYSIGLQQEKNTTKIKRR